MEAYKHKVSILVAVYNAENYLRLCLDSLLRQTLKDIQIVCVDDDSTDGSLHILREYEAADDRVTVLSHTQNMGIAATRNTALGVADGEFIGMLDADDWLEDAALEKAVGVFAGNTYTDCVLLRFVKAYEVAGGMRYDDFPMAPFEVLMGEEAFRKSLTWKIHGIYLVRATLHKAHPYDATARYYSDENTARIHYLLSREVRMCDGTYYYRQHSGSATHVVSVREFDKLKARESLKRQLKSLQVPLSTQRFYEREVWLGVIDAYFFYWKNKHLLSKEKRNYALDAIRKAWEEVDISALPISLRMKFGYMSLRCSWPLFRCQEEFYFFLKRLMGR